MNIDDIVESLNKHIEAVRFRRELHTTGHMVLQKEIIPNPTFKVYKTYKYVLWFTNKGKSYRVISIECTYKKALDEKEDSIIRKMSIEMSTQIFNWIGTNDYNQVIQGNYAHC